MTRNILVIEDDRDIARLVELHLRDEGYSVTVVPAGRTRGSPSFRWGVKSSG
jgi:DNA-binding response OmpR family regulator